MAWRQVPFPSELVERLDAIRASRPGRWTSRSEMARDLIQRGLEAQHLEPPYRPVS